MVKPTKQLMIELCTRGGIYQGLIQSLHHGLYEAPSLKDIYPYLDLDELVAFTASSWEERSRNHKVFSSFIDSADIHAIFLDVYKIGMPWLTKNQAISSKLNSRHEKLNHFDSRNLRDRLGYVDSDVSNRLKKELKEPVNTYVFDCQYQDEKMSRDGDNHRLIPMHFQTVYPRSGRIIPAYASETARIISNFPEGKLDLSSDPTSNSSRTEQVSLF